MRGLPFLARVVAALFLVLAAAVVPPRAEAQARTAFTYQGRLLDAGQPADGSYDLRFILYDADAGGSQFGPLLL